MLVALSISRGSEVSASLLTGGGGGHFLRPIRFKGSSGCNPLRGIVPFFLRELLFLKFLFFPREKVFIFRAIIERYYQVFFFPVLFRCEFFFALVGKGFSAGSGRP